MTELFIQLVNMSITASWLILAVLLFRMILHKVPKSLLIFIWVLLLIRCIFPYTFKSVFCIIPSTQTIPKDILSSAIPYIQSNISFIDTTINAILYENAMYQNSLFSSIEISMYFFTFVWIMGIIIIGIYFLNSLWHLKENVKLSLYYKDNIYYCEDIESPFIFGIKNPKIYLPMEIEDSQIKYVLLHEQLHIKRKDYIWKWIGTLLLILYWFNPMMWIAYNLFNKDLEMSIDELVVKDLNAQEKKAYCEALISLSNKENHHLFHTLAFGEINIKQRIKNVLRYHKPSVIKCLTTSLSCIILVFTCMSHPIQSNAYSQGISIHELTDWDSYSSIYDNVDRIEIGNENNSLTTILSADVKEVIDIVSNVKVMKNPISHNRSYERDTSNYLILQSETNTNIYFNHDLSELWICKNDKPSLSYRILNSEILYAIFDKNKPDLMNFIDLKIIDKEGECWIAQSISDENMLYQLKIFDNLKELHLENCIRIFYENMSYGNVFNEKNILSIYYLNEVEIVKVIMNSTLYTSKEIEEVMNKIILNSPQLKEYGSVELYYDEIKSQQFLDKHSIKQEDAIVVFATLKASTSIKESVRKEDGEASFVVGPNIFMSHFQH